MKTIDSLNEQGREKLLNFFISKGWCLDAAPHEERKLLERAALLNGTLYNTELEYGTWNTKIEVIGFDESDFDFAEMDENENN